MTDSSKQRGGLIQELRNRRVFRVATVYIGISFALIEVSDILFPMINAPDWSLKALVVILALGFPISVVLAWMFQFTSEGIRRSPRSGEKQTSEQKPLTGNGIIIALLVVIALLLAFPRYKESPANVDTSVQSMTFDSKSIAVLPFTPFADEREDEIFADGVHDDILTQLSKIADLKVISRTSVMQYKGTTKLIPDIARELGVANVLEGSVRRAGDQIRIVAQLINAQTDEHLWAETFDRKYADIFTVQTEVAKKIASAMQATLTEQEISSIEEKPTENLEAWELYSRAELLVYANQLDSAISLYEASTRLDPDFLLPVSRLARHYAWKYFDGTGTDPSIENFNKARKSLHKITAAAPAAPETRMARGYFYYYSARDYENALSEFYAALQTQPNNSDLFSAIAYVERRLGRWDESWEHLEKAVSLDPNNPEKVFEIRETARRMRKWESAEKYQKRFSAIRGGAAFGAEYVQYWISLDHHGDLEKLQAIHDDLNSRFSEYETIALRQWHKYITRDYKEGLAENIKLPFSDPFIRGNWYKLNGKTEEALAYYDTARVAAEARISENAEDWAAYTGLGLALAHLGKLDEAIKAGEKAVEIMPVHRDAWLGPQALDDLLNIYIECGEEVLAMDTIETLLSIPSDLTINRLKLMGIFDPLRDKPRFQRLLQVQS